MDLVAQRVVDALPLVSGRVLVRDRCGRPEVVEAVVAASPGQTLAKGRHSTAGRQFGLACADGTD